MKVSFDKSNSNVKSGNVGFKGYEMQKSKIGDFQYTFNFPYDSEKYDCYLELVAVKVDKNGDYDIICGLPNKNIDLSNVPNDVPDDEKQNVSMALPLKPGKTTISLSSDYGIPDKAPFGYHFKLVPKGGSTPIYKVDAGDVMDLSSRLGGYAHDIYNVVVPGSEGTDVGSAMLLVPDSYNVMCSYDKDGNVVPNLKYLNAIKATKNFSNKMGGSLAGIEHDLDAGKFDNYTKIISLPLFTDDSLTPHSYWNKNCMQMAHSLGNIKNYQNLQKKLFAKGINWVSDGAFVNEGLEGVHFRHVLKWGEKSPYFHWFRAANLKDKPLALGVFPKNHSIIGYKVVNAPFVFKTDDEGNITGKTANKAYTCKKPTFVQVFDKRLVTGKEAADNTTLIESYSILDTEDPSVIVTHHDTLPPYAFEFDPDILAKNMDDIVIYNNKVDKSDRLKKDSYEVSRIISRSENFVLDEKIEGGFDTWDANVDIAKVNYVYSKENIKDLHNILDSDKRDAYNDTITRNIAATRDYAITSAAFWTKQTNQILNLHVAQNLKNIDKFDAKEIMGLINENIKNKQVFPQKVSEVIDEDIVDNIIYDIYELKPLSKEEYKNVIISGMMDLPLDSVELGDNIISVLASPYMTKRAAHADEIGVSRFDMETINENTHLNDDIRRMYLKTNDLYKKEMYDFAVDILDMLNKRLPDDMQLNDGLNTSEYGKYVLPYVTQEIAKFAVIKGLFPNSEVKVDEVNGGIIYDYNKLKQTSLQELGINANCPEQEAEMLLSRLKGSKFMGKGIPAISDKDRKVLVEALYKMLEGTSATSFKLAQVIVNRTHAGLDWRIDATKDIADVESLRKKETDFEDTWGEIINFWSKFAKAVYAENPGAYLVAEVTSENELYNDGEGNKSPRYTFNKDIVMKFLRETGITSIANYGFFFTDIPAIFGKRIENGDDWGIEQYDKIYNLMHNGGNDFLHSGPLPSLISSYTFADNHDKPRILHGLAMDMELFYADLNKETESNETDSKEYRHKERAFKVVHGMFGPNDSVERMEVNNYDFTRIDSKAVAMGEALGTAFGNALENMVNGSFKTISENEREKAFIALAKALKDLSSGVYNGHIFQAEAFGVKPFDITIEMVVNQAINKHGLKFSDNEAENKELINKLKKETFMAALEPAMSKAVAIMKTLVALPGLPTLFAGDDIGSTGYEQLTKNIYLQNRSTLHWEWLEDDSPDKQFDFLKNYKQEIDNIMSTRKRPELHALNDGAIYLLPQNQCNNSPAKVNAILRQSTDGSMAVSLFNTSGLNHDFRQKNDPKKYAVKFDFINLNMDAEGAGLRCGLTNNLEFVDSKNPEEKYVVKREGDNYKIVKKDGGEIYMDDNTKILYYISPEFKTKLDRINSLKKVIDDNNKDKKFDKITYAKILDLKAKTPSFSGNKVKSRQLYNPLYIFRTAGAYNQPAKVDKGSKLSLISR